MEEKGGESAHDEDEGKGPEGQDEARAGVGFPKRQRPTAQVAKDERGPGLRGFLDGEKDVVQRDESFLDRRDLEEEEAERDLQERAGGDGPPSDVPAVLADGPGEGDEGREAESALKDQHGAALPLRRLAAADMRPSCERPLPFPLSLSRGSIF